MKFLASSNTPSTKAFISAAASATATLMVIRSLTRDLLPREVRDYIYFNLKSMFTSFSPQLTLLIDEYDNLNHNHLFKAAQLYLEPIIPPNTPRLKVSLPNKETKVSISLEKNEEITDTFKGVTLTWKFMSKHSSKVKYIPNPDSHHSTPVTETRCFELSFHKKHKTMVFDSYLDHVVAKSKEIMEKKKTLKLHTLGVHDSRIGWRRGDVWQAVNLDHPSTFETLAMDIDLKQMIMNDLQNFVKGKDFHRRVGKAWKRGYLLFGPPGTGKSSLIAAIANYLNFDIYDLELTDVKMNSDLRKLLISTANKSILVVEDIDCTIELQNRIAEARASKSRSSSNQGYDQGNQVTLSGLLNFIDGLWSSYGDERIIIFTTNHIEKLDPALLRPGRMDLQIHMSYCSPCGFRIMASNYLGITEHPLFLEIEELIEITKITPAEIGQQLMKSEQYDAALSGLIDFLHFKKTEQEDENKAKNKEVINIVEEKEMSIINGEIGKRY
ncbi:P-loop containing nucleoside triphosphate hydrolases superfamily protein [Euphorbia peplus]|nr:P-loop containing nucleoside triphosphate hydrolases superfamily protein [Euphorbia peplus]